MKKKKKKKKEEWGFLLLYKAGFKSDVTND